MQLFNLNELHELSEDVINQIKNFDRFQLTPEQKKLIDKLIPNEKLKERYMYYGLCEVCGQPYTNGGVMILSWCQSCNSKRYRQDFDKWSSGNKDVDELIQNTQLSATSHDGVLDWIPYGKFTDIEHLITGNFSTMHKAKWIGGPSFDNWNVINNDVKVDVALKRLNNSQNITEDFLQEVIYSF